MMYCRSGEMNSSIFEWMYFKHKKQEVYILLGAIIGDIVGSIFEFSNHRSKEFELFTENCFVTDDSIMTLAVAKAIMESKHNLKPPANGFASDCDYNRLLEDSTVKYMQEIGRQYPNCGYGGMLAAGCSVINLSPTTAMAMARQCGSVRLGLLLTLKMKRFAFQRQSQPSRIAMMKGSRVLKRQSSRFLWLDKVPQKVKYERKFHVNTIL